MAAFDAISGAANYAAGANPYAAIDQGALLAAKYGALGKRMSPSPSGQYSAPSSPPPTVPGPIPSIDDFLNSDAGYQQQINDLGNSLSQFLADVGRRRGTLQTDYGVSQKALSDQRVQDLANLENDYGARGILRSGLYGKAVGDYETEYGNRQSDLARQEQDALAQLDQQTSSFQSSQDLQKQAAMADAIRRRAANYGI